jgi:hypothetical protein
MALVFFESADSSNNMGDLPFAEELAKNPKMNGVTFEVTEVRNTKKGTGKLLISDGCLVFLFNRNKTLRLLLDGLKYYVTQGSGYGLFLKIDKSATDGYRLAIDPEVPRVWYEGNGGFSLLPTQLEEGGGTTNPFLLPVPSPQSRESTSTTSPSEDLPTRRAKKTHTLS